MVKFGVMKSHDGFDAGPSSVFGIDSKATVIGGIGDIGIHEA